MKKSMAGGGARARAKAHRQPNFCRINFSCLNEQALRFTEFQKRMGDVNSKTVTSHLRDLEKYHIINRTIYPEVPPRVEYSLTSHGKAFLPVFEVIREWGQSLPPPSQ